jgi:hypothetical protein
MMICICCWYTCSSISTLEHTHKEKNAQPWHIRRANNDDAHWHIRIDTILMCDILSITTSCILGIVDKCRGKTKKIGKLVLLVPPPPLSHHLACLYTTTAVDMNHRRFIDASRP